MSHKNYSGFSKKKNQQHDQQISVDEVLELNESPVQEVEATITEEHVVVTGKVEGCERLNVRAESNKDSDVVCIINKSTEVVIDLENSTEDFYKITTSQGINGYCMKKFITVLSKSQ